MWKRILGNPNVHRAEKYSVLVVEIKECVLKEKEKRINWKRCNWYRLDSKFYCIFIISGHKVLDSELVVTVMDRIEVFVLCSKARYFFIQSSI